MSGIPPSAATSVVQGALLYQVMALTGNFTQQFELYQAIDSELAEQSNHTALVGNLAVVASRMTAFNTRLNYSIVLNASDL